MRQLALALTVVAFMFIGCGSDKQEHAGAEVGAGKSGGDGGSAKEDPASLSAQEIHRRMTEMRKLIAMAAPGKKLNAARVIQMFGRPTSDKWATPDRLLTLHYKRPDGTANFLFDEWGALTHQWLSDTPEQRAEEARARENARKRAAEEAVERAAEQNRRVAEEQARREKQKREAEQARVERARKKEGDIARRAAGRDAMLALAQGTYRLLNNTIGWRWVKAEIGGERGKRAPDAAVEYFVGVRSGGTAEALLRVSGEVVWRRLGTWRINWDKSSHDGGSPTIRPHYVAVEVTLSRDGVGSYRPANGMLHLEVWADGRDVKATLVARGVQYMKRSPGDGAIPGPTAHAESTGGAAIPTTGNEARRGEVRVSDIVGTYQPTAESLKELKARLGKSVRYRLELKSGMKFTTTYKKGSTSTIKTTGTWKLRAGFVELRATRQKGKRLRRAKVDRFPLLEGGKLKMDYVVLEKR